MVTSPPGLRLPSFALSIVLSGLIGCGEAAEPGPIQGAGHWAYQPIAQPSPPALVDYSWLRQPLDAFILARLEKSGIRPAPEASPATLLRRVHLDLTGLPPSPTEQQHFLNDTAPNAYERAVDRLLASPHFGERWARWWLDVARYADSSGYSSDEPRSIWPWRDWVIHAFNADRPYDSFVIDQLAGDLLPDATLDQRVATGFHRNTQINQEGGIDKEQFRIESVIDRVNTTGTAFLGLTIGCAQCHNHKFDPLSQREYFQFYAFFNQQDEPALEVPGLIPPAAEIKARLKLAEADWDKGWTNLGPTVSSWAATLTPTALEALPVDVRAALATPPAQQSRHQRRQLALAAGIVDPAYLAREQRLSDLENRRNLSAPTLVLVENPTPRTNVIFIKGDFTRPGPEVFAAVPAVLPPLASRHSDRPPDRLDLAHWLVSGANPLPARVLVNRIWQQLFGRGLVETENDFGTQGSPPSHPELLDWLASRFRSGDTGSDRWRIKSLLRLIVTSATYRQSSLARPELATLDPLNRLKARQSRLRLDAEIIRDVALVASGLLAPSIGGPSVFPPQPEGVLALGQVKRQWATSTGADRYRRGLYTWIWRATPHPALSVFDGADGLTACTRRLRSNTPLQALTLLNDTAFVEFAEALAVRVQQEAAPPDRLNLAFHLCLSRAPSTVESLRLQQLWLEERNDHGEAAAWNTITRVLLNLDETITRE